MGNHRDAESGESRRFRELRRIDSARQEYWNDRNEIEGVSDAVGRKKNEKEAYAFE